MDIQRSGSQPSQNAPSEHFTGRVRIDALFQAHEPGMSRRASPRRRNAARSPSRSTASSPGKLVTRQIALSDVTDTLERMTRFDTVGFEVITRFA